MFEGSQHHDKGFFHPLQEAGALLNGSTNADRTNYWEVVPTNALELAFWMESDRMGFLLPALTDAKFQNQREVVLNERRQNYENRPYGFASMAMMSALYPPDHPYSWMTIGAADDIRAARLDDVRAFFQTYYRPGNASLALAGDVDTEVAMDLAGAVLRRSRRRRGSAAVEADAPAPPCGAAAPARRSCRTAAVVHGLALAAAVRRRRCGARPGGRSAGQRQNVATVSLPGLRGPDGDRDCGIAKFARAGRLLSNRRHRRARADAGRTGARHRTGLDALVDEGPVPREMERCQAQAEANFVYRLQTVGGFGGKSDQLNAYNIFVGDPGFFDRDLDRYRRSRRPRCSVRPRMADPVAACASERGPERTDRAGARRF